MRVDLLTREYPPFVYGGAGVHVAELARVLQGRVELHVRCFDGPRDAEVVTGYSVTETAHAAFDVLATNLRMAHDASGADLVHSHTWYANTAGHLAAALYGIPHVLTAHSLEPLRPWKAEQLGGGYRVTSWIEKSAYEAATRVIAVSAGMRADVLRVYPFVDPDLVDVVHNGIDVDTWHPPLPDHAEANLRVVTGYGIDPDRPTATFVGRITQQKGLAYLLAAADQLPPDVQLVLCAGAPDTPAFGADIAAKVADLQARRTGVVWIEKMLPRHELLAVLGITTTFVCPSVYEPLGIVNLEAMAVGLPVVATATGGIPEVVADGVTGTLVHLDQADDGTGAPSRPEEFIAALAEAIAAMVADPERARAMGAAGRDRAEQHFSWDAIADQTIAVYERALGK